MIGFDGRDNLKTINQYGETILRQPILNIKYTRRVDVLELHDSII